MGLTLGEILKSGVASWQLPRFIGSIGVLGSSGNCRITL